MPSRLQTPHAVTKTFSDAPPFCEGRSPDSMPRLKTQSWEDLIMDQCACCATRSADALVYNLTSRSWENVCTICQQNGRLVVDHGQTFYVYLRGQEAA